MVIRLYFLVMFVNNSIRLGRQFYHFFRQIFINDHLNSDNDDGVLMCRLSQGIIGYALCFYSYSTWQGIPIIFMLN